MKLDELSMKLDTKQNMIEFVHRATLVGHYVQAIRTACGHECYLVGLFNDNYLLLVPEDVKRFVKYSGVILDDKLFIDAIRNLRGTIKVIGGKALEDAGYLFFESKLSKIDVSELDTNKVKSMEAMFSDCEADELDLSNFRTHNVENMNYMFFGCHAYKINVESFDTSSVDSALAMFANCYPVKRLNLTSFKFNSDVITNDMFSNCHRDLVVETTDKKILDEYENRQMLRA